MKSSQLKAYGSGRVSTLEQRFLIRVTTFQAHYVSEVNYNQIVITGLKSKGYAIYTLIG